MTFGRLAWTALGTAAVLAAQGLAPDEVHARRIPYVPPPPTNVLRTQVELVEVPVVVRDGKHRAIGSLKQSDFQVFDAGKKQTITSFSVESFEAAAPGNAPIATANPPSAPAATPGQAVRLTRYVVLLFDNLTTPFADLRRIKSAAEHFVQNGLAPGDLVAVVTTGFAQSATFTADVPRLVESIEKIPLQQRPVDDWSSCPRITAYQAYVIADHLDNETLMGVATEDMGCKNLPMRDAIADVTSLSNMIWEHAKANSLNALYSIRGVVDALGKLPGRRMLLLSSSGFLSGDLEYFEDELISRALHAEVVINSLDAKGLYTYNVGGRPIDAPAPRSRSMRTQIAEAKIEGRQAQAKDDAMAVLALGTGGTFYHNSNDLDHGFQELGTVPESVYLLGFTPSDAAPDGRYHSLKVKLAGGNHYSVQSRMGYTAPTKAPPTEQRPLSKLDAEAVSSDTLTDVASNMTAEPAAAQNGSPAINLLVSLDLSHLKFDTSGGRHAQKLTLIAALLDKEGNFVTGMRGEVDLSLKPDTFERLAASGFNVRLLLQAPAGAYTLRGVVQEGLEGKMSASSEAVELR